MSVDILGTSRAQCRSLVQYCFTATETMRLVRTDSPGLPHRLSHNSWTMCILRMVECCFTSRETVGLLGTGAQDGHLDIHTAPELCILRLMADLFNRSKELDSDWLRSTSVTRQGDRNHWWQINMQWCIMYARSPLTTSTSQPVGRFVLKNYTRLNHATWSALKWNLLSVWNDDLSMWRIRPKLVIIKTK